MEWVPSILPYTRLQELRPFRFWSFSYEGYAHNDPILLQYLSLLLIGGGRYAPFYLNHPSTSRRKLHLFRPYMNINVDTHYGVQSGVQVVESTRLDELILEAEVQAEIYSRQYGSYASMVLPLHPLDVMLKLHLNPPHAGLKSMIDALEQGTHPIERIIQNVAWYIFEPISQAQSLEVSEESETDGDETEDSS